MLKFSALSLLAAGFLVGGCSTSSQTGATSSASSTNSTRSSGASTAGGGGDLVWVEPPTGSHIGGGFVRVPRGGAGQNDEAGLQNAIASINAAEQRQRQQPMALSVAAQVSGASQQQILAQQNQTHQPLGDLLALNLIAHNQPAKVQQLAAQKSQGKSWSDLARSNGVRIADLAQRVRRADELTAKLYVQRRETGADDLRNLQGSGVAPQSRAPGSGPSTH